MLILIISVNENFHQINTQHRNFFFFFECFFRLSWEGQNTTSTTTFSDSPSTNIQYSATWDETDFFGSSSLSLSLSPSSQCSFFPSRPFLESPRHVGQTRVLHATLWASSNKCWFHWAFCDCDPRDALRNILDWASVSLISSFSQQSRATRSPNGRDRMFDFDDPVKRKRWNREHDCYVRLSQSDLAPSLCGSRSKKSIYSLLYALIREIPLKFYLFT